MFGKKKPEASTSEADRARIRSEVVAEVADRLHELADEMVKKDETPQVSAPAPTPAPPRTPRGHGAPAPKMPDKFL